MAEDETIRKATAEDTVRPRDLYIESRGGNRQEIYFKLTLLTRLARDSASEEALEVEETLSNGAERFGGRSPLSRRIVSSVAQPGVSNSSKPSPMA